MIQLGQKVRDIVTGFEGIATSRLEPRRTGGPVGDSREVVRERDRSGPRPGDLTTEPKGDTMKRFEELTDAELVDLSDEDVSRYVDLACAEAGVPFLPPEPKEPPKPTVEPDRLVYVVAGVHFADKEDAERASEFLAGCRRVTLDYAPGGSYKHRVVKTDDEIPLVQVERHFSTDHWDAHRKEVQEYEAAKKEHDSAETEYTEAAKKRGGASEWIYDRISEARETEYRRRTLSGHYERYLSLANGDAKVAAKFLADAHHDAMDLLPELFQFAEEPAEVAT